MSLRALGRFDGHWVTGYPTILKRTWCRVGTTPRPFGFKKQAETFHSLGTCEESSWHFHRTSCFCARFSNFKVCFGGTYWNALSFSEAPQNGTESENCGSISTVSLKITGKNIGLRRSREGLWRSVTQGSGTRSTQIFYDLLYLHIQNFRKLISQGQAVSVHLLNTWYGIIVGQHLENCPLHISSLSLSFDLLSSCFLCCMKTLGQSTTLLVSASPTETLHLYRR